ncbi:hypothetical protein KA107_00655 [Candidatus Pacearchaeota archaeon]|nr:hypothetical protein [Candidatus Pacearchaeota archaeon]
MRMGPSALSGTGEETRAYSLTIIPFQADGKAIYRGKDYTLSAGVHNVTIDGTKYYIRQDGAHNGDLSEQVQKALGIMFAGKIIKKPTKITLEEFEE